jgi:hypothetical protein
MIIRTAKITRGGEISIPSGIRRRWGTSTLALEDLGDRIVLRPVPMTRWPPRAVALAAGSSSAAEICGRPRARRRAGRSAPRVDELSVPLDAFAPIALFAEEPAAEQATE